MASIDSAEPPSLDAMVDGREEHGHGQSKYPPTTDAMHGEGPGPSKHLPWKIRWRNVAKWTIRIAMAIYGLYLLPGAHILTWAWSGLCYFLSIIGITAGAHRLWCHRSYTAKLPFRVFLALCQTMSAQTHIINWVIIHRAHHKYSDTDGDLHNASRGFFFSHIGHFLVEIHPDAKKAIEDVDSSDLYKDPVCIWQRRLFMPASVFMTYVLPTIVPMWGWGESFCHAFLISGMLRQVLAMNAIFLINSAAHMCGNRPYDKRIGPVQNIATSVATAGEGFHNYHHTFPQDYRASEFGWKINATCLLIDAMAAIGQVTNRKTMSREIVGARMKKTGDGSQEY